MNPKKLKHDWFDTSRRDYRVDDEARKSAQQGDDENNDDEQDEADVKLPKSKKDILKPTRVDK